MFSQAVAAENCFGALGLLVTRYSESAVRAEELLGWDKAFPFRDKRLRSVLPRVR